MSARPRALLITPDYPPAHGGIQNLLHGLVRHATRVEFRVVTVGRPAPDVDDGRVVIRRAGARWDSRAQMVALNIAALDEARRFRPHVVLSGHIVASPAATLIRAPVVQYLYGMELVMSPRLAGFALRGARASIALSRHAVELALQAGAPAQRLHRIPPGIDLPPARADEASRQPAVLSVARLEERYKGTDTLIRALPLVRSRVPEAVLIVVGDGSLRLGLEALAAANGVADAVTFTGEVTNARRDELLRTAALLAMPSRALPRAGGEGFGIVYLEAGAHGLPVVAGNVGGALDAVVDGETGLLVAPDDHVGVADAIVALLTDRERAAVMGAAARRHAERFAWPSIAGQVEDVLLAVAEAR